jgi:hypothetical protein
MDEPAATPPPPPAPDDPLPPLPPPPPAAEFPPDHFFLPHPPVAAESVPSSILFWFAALAAAAGYVGLWFGGKEAQRIAAAGLESLPFLLLAVFAYTGLRSPEMRLLTGLYWLLLLALVGLGAIGLTAAAVIDPQMVAGNERPANPRDLFLAGGIGQLRRCVFGVFGGMVLGALGFVPAVRRAVARVVPFDPHSFVHATALATVLGVAVVCFVPLLVMREPPLLLVVDHFRDDPRMADLSKEDQLRDQLYGLGWLVPAAIVAVGFPRTRTLGEALRRVGLVVPTPGQVLFAVLAAGVMVVAMSYGVDYGIGRLWEHFGWPQTDEKAFEQLVQFAINPLGAVVIGVTAGLGEELSVRGVLQPRLGILLSNLLFTSLHALQYNGDALLSVFTIGLVLGLIRKYTNTTTSAIVHGLYDFTLVLLTYYRVELGW